MRHLIFCAAESAERNKSYSSEVKSVWIVVLKLPLGSLSSLINRRMKVSISQALLRIFRAQPE
jgi:hypothetical protein